MRNRIWLFLLFVCVGFDGYTQFSPQCYIVEENGEALWRIAQKSYDSKNYKTLDDYCKVIALWNSIDINNINLKQGQKIWLVDPQTIQKESNQGDETAAGSDETLSENKADTTKQNVSVSSQQANQKERSATNKKTKKSKRKPEEDGVRSYSWVWLLLGLLVGLVLGIALFYALFVKKLKTELEHKESELLQVNSNLYKEKSNANTEMARLRSKIQSLEREKQELLNENVALGEEIDRLKPVTSGVLNDINKTEVESKGQTSNQASKSSATLYADAIIDGCFVKTYETPDEDSIFVLNLNGENSAAFEVYESAYKRVIANPSFLEGCEKQILGDSMQLEIVSKGMAQKDFSSGKWKVVNKLNVIIR